MGTWLRRLARRGTRAHLRHLSPVEQVAAPALVRRVFAQVERDFGLLAPPVRLHAAAPETLAAAWVMLRETLLATGAASRAAKEAVAVAVSRENACPYCVAVHATALHGLLPGREADAGSAGLTGSRTGDDAAARWQPLWAGADPAHRAELLGTALTFHYLNRMVNVFLVESPFPATSPMVSRFIRRAASAVIRPILQRPLAPGQSLGLLPPAAAPRDLGWAAGHPALLDAFGRAFAAIDAAGERSLPAAVRALVGEALASWDGTPPGPGSDAVSRRVADLPAAQQPAGRLALLTALASFRIGDTVIAGFRQRHPDDRDLVEATAWASLAAARWWAARWVRQLPPDGSVAGPQQNRS